MNGILLIDKPIGMTSHDVVAQVRRILRQSLSSEIGDLSSKSSQKIKVGHTGTLDPLASGLMILVIGSYTKKAQEFSKLDKTYQAEITLGSTSATGVAEGPIINQSDNKPTETELQKVLETFVGEISQTPHAHSAVKIDGQRAYKLARAGKEFKIEPRQVKIYSLKLVDYDYPKLNIVTKVSSGTYIRSLAEDIGKQLGTGAYLSALRRTTVGKFDIKGAVTLESLHTDSIAKHLI